MRKLPVALIGTTVVVAGALALRPADAHHPALEVACLDAPATIRVVATAWDAPTLDERVNDNIEITFDGTVVGVGAFNAGNGYRFTLDFVAPVTSGTHTVRATSLHPWGPNEDDPHPTGVGEFREASITLPCAATAATTTPNAPTTTAPEVTTTAGPTTTVPTLVEGVSVTRPDIPEPIAVAPRFAG